MFFQQYKRAMNCVENKFVYRRFTDISRLLLYVSRCSFMSLSGDLFYITTMFLYFRYVRYVLRLH